MWETAEALEAFEASPASHQLLEDLHCQMSRPPLHQLLKDLKFETAPPSLFALEEHYCGTFSLEQNLHGRITLTILHVRVEDDILANTAQQEVPYRKPSLSGFLPFLPAGCRDLHGPRCHSRLVFTWSTREHQQQRIQPDGTRAAREALCYLFFRWNGYHGTPEREEAAAQDAKARKSWADAVAKVMPPVVAWEQERWHIKTAPCYSEEIPYHELHDLRTYPSDAEDYQSDESGGL